jgi:hypothetical protein
MTDTVFNIDSMDDVVNIAQHFGHYDAELGIVLYGGASCGEGGPAFFCTTPGTVMQPTGQMLDGFDDFGNPMQYPEMVALPGVWGRLRIAGESDFVDQVKAYAAANNIELTTYNFYPEIGENGAWSSDGVTPAPDYVATTHVIM